MRNIFHPRKLLSLVLAIFIAGITFNSTATPDRVDPICVASHLEHLSNADLIQQLSLMQQAGIIRTRFDFNMATIEPLQGKFVWGLYDNIVNTAASYGITVLADIEQYNTPDWANGNQGSMYAPNPSIYHDYAQAIASHYIGKISLFEMGNEPNSSIYWPPAPDAASYAALLQAGYNGVKAGNPHAKVISAGLSQANPPNDPISFLTAMYASGVKGHFDYLGIHPYSQPNGPDFISHVLSRASFNTVPALKNLMKKEGDQNKQIIITEIGWPTTSDFSGGGVTQSFQAAYISRVYTKIMYDYQYIPIACIYDFVNDGTTTAYGEDNFGILNADYTQKPSYTSMKVAASDFSSNFTAISP